MEGGIVFYVDQENWRGLVTTEADLGRAVWGRTDYEIGGWSTYYYEPYAPQLEELFDGAENTEAIVNSYWYFEGDYAAGLCAELELNGYDDWYLPSRMELANMETNLYWFDLGNFVTGYYWSSTEQNEEDAYLVYFGWMEYEADEADKDKKNRVRPVRMFDYSANKTP